MKRLLLFLSLLLFPAAMFAQSAGPANLTGSQCLSINVFNTNLLIITVTGSWHGSLQPQVFTQTAQNTTVTPIGISAAQPTITANGTFTTSVYAANNFRVCANNISGTATVTFTSAAQTSTVANITGTQCATLNVYIAGTAQITVTGNWGGAIQPKLYLDPPRNGTVTLIGTSAPQSQILSDNTYTTYVTNPNVLQMCAVGVSGTATINMSSASLTASLFIAGGDLSGNATSQEVVGLLNNALPSLSNGCLNWTGTAWSFTSCTGGVTSFTGDDGTPRTGAVVTQATDYGTKGVTQVGTGTLNFKCGTLGTCFYGNTSNFIRAYPTSNSLGILWNDQFSNQASSSSGGWLINTNAQSFNMQGGATPSTNFGFTVSSATYVMQLFGSYIQQNVGLVPVITNSSFDVTSPIGLSVADPAAETSNSLHYPCTWTGDESFCDLNDNDGPWDFANGVSGPIVRPDTGQQNQTALSYGATLTNMFCVTCTFRNPLFLNDTNDLVRMYNGTVNPTITQTPAAGQLAEGKDPSTDALMLSYGDTFRQAARVIGAGTTTTNGTQVNAGVSQSQPTITISGATNTDTATCSLNAAMPATWQTGIQLLTPVVTANTVTVWLGNPTAGNLTPAATIVRCTVTR